MANVSVSISVFFKKDCTINKLENSGTELTQGVLSLIKNTQR